MAPGRPDRGCATRRGRLSYAEVKVSFVLPTRNRASFIRKCLDSCLAQRLDEPEVIVVDGLSTDGTQNILRGYGDLLRWVSERDAGQSDAVNKGVGLASGTLIAWINSDDYYPHERVLPRVVEVFEAEPSVDLVYGDGLMVDVGGEPIRPFRGRPFTSAQQLLVCPSSPFLQPAVFFRKSLFRDVGGLALDLHYAMDYDLWIRMWERARSVRYVPATLACGTYHPEAKSIHDMRRQIRELVTLKLRHGRRLGLTPFEWARAAAGVLALYGYWAVTTLRLRRAV